MPPSEYEADDYQDIETLYYKDIIATGDVIDICGWQTTSCDLPYAPAPESGLRFDQYKADHQDTLGHDKSEIADLVSRWDNRRLTSAELTLLPSVSSATLATLMLIKDLGIEQILFETPAYFATIEQAEQLGIQVRLVPTYYCNGYLIDQQALSLPNRPFTFWITQPRCFLGINQSLDHITALLSRLRKYDMLVVDEANEQNVPTVLAPIEDARIIRIRGFFKPLGLNGLRISAILHHSSLRKRLERHIWSAGGAIDAYSLRAITALAREGGKFMNLLSVARVQAERRRIWADAATKNFPVFPAPLVNGYIGSLAVGRKHTGMDGTRFRHWLASMASKQKMVLLFGPSMLFARDHEVEHIRVNYFSPPNHVENGITALINLLCD